MSEKILILVLSCWVQGNAFFLNIYICNENLQYIYNNYFVLSNNRVLFFYFLPQIIVVIDFFFSKLNTLISFCPFRLVHIAFRRHQCKYTLTQVYLHLLSFFLLNFLRILIVIHIQKLTKLKLTNLTQDMYFACIARYFHTCMNHQLLDDTIRQTYRIGCSSQSVVITVKRRINPIPRKRNYCRCNGP